MKDPTSYPTSGPQDKSPEKVVYSASVMAELYDYLTNPPPAIMLPDFPILMKTIRGLRSREFTILCGSTGSGKSSFLANWSAQLCAMRKKHLVIAVENGYLDHAARVLSILENRDFNNGEPIDKKLAAVATAKHLETLFGNHLTMSTHTNRIAMPELMGMLKTAVAMGTELVFIDNINFLLEPAADQNAVMVMDRVIHDLVVFCKENPVHIVMVMHPRKTDGENGRILSEFDIKGSSTAVQEASNILLFNKPPREMVEQDLDLRYFREILIRKCRRFGHAVGTSILFDGTEPKYKEKGNANDYYKAMGTGNDASTTGRTRFAPSGNRRPHWGE